MANLLFIYLFKVHVQGFILFYKATDPKYNQHYDNVNNKKQIRIEISEYDTLWYELGL